MTRKATFSGFIFIVCFDTFFFFRFPLGIQFIVSFNMNPCKQFISKNESENEKVTFCLGYKFRRLYTS